MTRSYYCPWAREVIARQVATITSDALANLMDELLVSIATSGEPVPPAWQLDGR